VTTAEQKPGQTPGISRRSFLGNSAAAGLGITLVGSADMVFGAAAASESGSRPDPGPFRQQQ
jgi:hypothetical protein